MTRPPETPVLDVPQVAALLRCEPKTVQGMARSGLLPGIKAGTDWVFPAGALYQRLDALALEEAARRRQPPKPAATVHQVKPATPPRGRRGANALPVLPRLPEHRE